MRAGVGAEDVTFQRLDGLLQPAAVLTGQRDVMAAGLGDGVSDFHGRVRLLHRAPSGRWELVEAVARIFKLTGGSSICRAVSVACVEALQPGTRKLPALH